MEVSHDTETEIKVFTVEFNKEKLQQEEFYHLMFATGTSLSPPMKYMIDGEVWEFYDYGIMGLYDLDNYLTLQSHGMYQVEYIQYLIWKYGDRVQNYTKIMVGKFRRLNAE